MEGVASRGEFKESIVLSMGLAKLSKRPKVVRLEMRSEARILFDDVISFHTD